MTRESTIRLSRISIDCGNIASIADALQWTKTVGAWHGWEVGYALVSGCGCVSLCRTEEGAQRVRQRSLLAMGMAVATAAGRVVH